MTLPSKEEVLERERRWLRPAGVVAIAGALLFAAGVVVQQVGLPAADDDAERLTQFHDHATQLLAGQALQGLGFSLFAFPLLVLFKAAEGRAERVRGSFVAFCLIGPILIGISTIVFSFGIKDVADQFVEQAPAVEQTARDEAAPPDTPDEAADDARENLAEDLAEDSGTVGIGQNLRIPAFLGLLVALVYTSLWAMRVGLLTRFWGSLGMALAVSLILLGPFGLFLTVLWFAVLGLRFAGVSPKGLPPAWAAGVAVPWEPPPMPASQRGPGEGNGGDVEGSGREVSEPPLPDAGAQPDDPDAPIADREQPGETQGQRRRKRKRRG